MRAGMLCAGGRVGLAGRAGGERAVGAARVVRPASGRGDPLRGRADGRRRRASSSSRSSWPTSSCPSRRTRIPRAAAALRSPLRRRVRSRARRARRRSCTARGQRPAGGGGHGPRGRGPEGTESIAPRRPATSAGVTRHQRRRAGRARCGSSSSWPTAGRRSARCRPCATRSRRRWPRPATPAGTGCVADQREYLDDFWEPGRRRGRRRPRAAAGRALRAVPRRCRPAPAPSGGRSRRRA